MKNKLIYFILGVIVAGALLSASVVYAQGATLWQLVGTKLAPVVSSWGLRIPSLGSSGNPCVKVDASGNFATTTCGGVAINTLNGLTATTQTFSEDDDTNVGLTITSSGSNHEFAVDWIGTLAAGRGGTGISNPTAAYVLVGSYAGGSWQQIATSSLGLLTTHVAEGSNLYWTQGRFDTAFGLKSTTDLAEGSNQYFTNERADDRVASLIQDGTGISWAYNDGAGTLTPTVSLSPFSTTNLAEGSNLYFTPDRAVSALAPFRDWSIVNGALAPTTTIGVMVNASSTIGNGTQANGLTISGGATTTGSAYIAGNLGIGTTTPAGKLHIFTAGGGSTARIDTQSSTALAVLTLTDVNTSSGSSNIYYTPSGAANTNILSVPNSSGFQVGAGGTGGFWFNVRANAPIVFATGGNTFANERMRITGTGLVGIGTTSPYALLSVGGDVVVGASTAGGTLGDLYLPKLGTAAGTYLAADPTGKVIATTSPAAGGITSLGAAGQGQTGSTQTLATTTDTNVGLTITSSGDAHMFTSTWAGSLAAGRGGTGITSPSAAGVLVGSYAGGGWQQISTSTLGLLTTHVAEGSNLYFTDERVDDRVDALVLDGTGITTSYNDGAGSLTINSTLGTDITAAEIANGDHGDFTYTGGVAAIDPNAVVLATDTSGNFLATLTSSGSITIGNSGSENAAATADLNMANANSWTALQQFANASSTKFSAYQAWFGATATSTFGTDGALTLATPLAVGSGGTGASSLNNLITLGTHTTGNYLATLANGGGLTVSGSGSETAAATVSLDLTNANTWTGIQRFYGSASSTLFSAHQAYFGATATSSFSSTGALTLATPLAVSSGGTGASTLNDLITLGTHTSGNYLATLSSSGSITVGGSGSETAAGTVNLNMANANNWTALQQFANASSTIFSAYAAYFGATATSTFDGAGNLTLAGSLTKGGDTITDFSGFGLAVSSNALGLDTTGAADGECLKYVSAGPATNWDTCGGGGSSKWTETTMGGRTVSYLTTLTSDLLIGGNSTSTSGFWFDRVATTTKIGQYGLGDSVLRLTANGSATTTLGVDYSDLSNFKISVGDQLGVNDAFIIGASRVATTSVGAWIGAGGTQNFTNMSGGDLYVQDGVEIDGTLNSTNITNSANFFTVGQVIDEDGTYPSQVAGSLIIGDGSDTGTLEIEDGPACIGDGGCTPNATDGSLLVENVGYFTTGIAIDSDATFPTPSAGSLIVGDGTDTFTVEFEDGPLCVGDGGCTPYAGDGTIMAAVGIGIASSTVPTPGIEFWINGQAILQGLTSSGTGNAVCISTTFEVLNAGGGTCTPSSIRFKENVLTLDAGEALAIIKQMRVVSFDYKEGVMDEKDRQAYGLIAEEVEQIDPRLVDYGADGNVFSLHFERILGLIVQAIQELTDDNDKQDARLDALEDRITALEAENKALRDGAPVALMCSAYEK